MVHPVRPDAVKRSDPVTPDRLMRPYLRMGAGAAALGLVLALSAGARAQGPGFGGPGGPGAPEREVVAQFDRDDNRRLDAEERRAAREWLASQGTTVRGFGRARGFPGGGGDVSRSPGVRLQPSDVAPVVGPSLYDSGTVRTLFLEFENAAWEEELEVFYNTDVDVPATLVVDGRTYPDVGVHFRGASSYMMVPRGAKRSLNLAIDFADDDQRLLGYRTLNLLNANGDPTFVRTLLYADIASDYVPTPKVNYVRVAINGEDWGIYLNAQQFNSDFTRDAFGTTAGARWKVPGSPFGRGGMEYLGEDVDAYRRIYDIRSRDEPRAWSDLIRLFRVLDQTPADRLEAALAPLLDIDGALKFLAVEAALVNSDGYWTRASDYNIYQARDGRFHVIPHDVNEALADGRGGPGFARGPGRGGATLDPLVGLDDSSKPLRSKLLAVPALRERYLAYVRDVAERWLDWTTLEPRARRYQALIAPYVTIDTRKLYTLEAFESGLAGGPGTLQSFVEQRRAYLLGRQQP